jgi:tRNA-specific 2-thiouridylase
MTISDVNWLGETALNETADGLPIYVRVRSTRAPQPARIFARDGALDRAADQGAEIFVRVRSTRAPQPAWLRRGEDGYEVELVAGEEGVSPGQACVFYDAGSGQARVLGGGFIKRAMASNTAAQMAGEARSSAPLVAGLRS